MKTGRFLSSAVLLSVPLAMAAFSACTTTTTTFVDGPVDSGALETTEEAADAAEAPPPDAATEKPDDGKCHPTSSAGLAKAAYAPPRGGYLGTCTGAMITSYVACSVSKTASACNDLETDGGLACIRCIESEESDPAWGPLVTREGELTVNEAGCGALNNADTGTSGCGQGLASYTECLAYTCGGQCTGAEYTSCANEARVTECKSTVDTLKSSCTADVGECFASPGDTAATLLTRVINRFCGARTR